MRNKRLLVKLIYEEIIMEIDKELWKLDIPKFFFHMMYPLPNLVFISSF